jgi:sterol desaturase/sphingolipid hydroxylase (fatty acid hydroxylase superfamily)
MNASNVQTFPVIRLKHRIFNTMLLPFLIIMIVAAIVVLQKLNVDPELWPVYIFNGATILILVMEQMFPRNRAWNYFNKDGFQFKTACIDLVFFLSSDSISTAISLPIALWLANAIKGHSHLPSLASLSFPIQGVILLLAIEFSRYWIHRGMHSVGFMWRFHSLHHMQTRIGALSGTRSNPLDDLMIFVPENVLILALGFDLRLVAGLFSFIAVMSVVKHANVEFEENWFSQMFQIPSYHLLHHKLQPATDTLYNYSDITTFWDRVFRTFKSVPLTVDHKVGVETPEPRGIVRELFGWLYLPIERL